MKKTFLVTFCLAGIAGALFAFTTNDPGYKNLKVLPQTITERQMDSVMHHFSNALNVKCNFCHVRNESDKSWDYASDANKHKLIARDMMVMTNEINDKYFDFTGGKRDLNTQLTVTCVTCHNGAKQPETIAKERPDDKDKDGKKSGKKEKD